MKIAVLHGQNHKGITYHTTQMVLDPLRGPDTQVEDFYFVDATACAGCFQCFFKGENACPHAEQNAAIIAALEQADVIVLESPTYCMGMAGQLKVFLDHMGYRWIPHRPHPAMFHKVGLCVSTTAGAGAKKVAKDMAQHLFFWGVPRTFRLGLALQATSWAEIPAEKKEKIRRKAEKIARKIRKGPHPTAGIKTRIVFSFVRLMQKKGVWLNKTDRAHWEQQGWLDNARPWKG